MTAESAAGVIATAFDRLARDYAVMLLDRELRIATWSAGAEHLFGYATREVLGQPSDLIFAPEDRQQQVPQHEAEIAREAGSAYDDRWHLRKDGSRFWASGAMIALPGDAGEPAGFMKVMRDRTDLRSQIVALRNRLAAEVDEQRRKAIMLGTLAHELRNPLAPLANAAQLIRLAVADDRLHYPLQIIDRQLAFLKRLIDDLLDVGRVGTGRLRLDCQPFLLQDALREALQTVEPDAKGRGHALRALVPQMPIEIEADRDRVQQIVVNLLNNAVRYTPPGGRILLKATHETGWAIVRVEDNGIGIAPELQPSIFDLFTQATPGTGRGSGLGIGLALVKELVAAHGGTVAVRSEGLDKGSEFTVRLPLKPPAFVAA
jgi:two-component system CheB/CheR fusion protein